MAEITYCAGCGGKKVGAGGFAHKENCPEVTGAMQEIIGTPAQGWQCPSCGQVYGPSVALCYNCRPRVETTDSTEGPVEHL